MPARQPGIDGKNILTGSARDRTPAVYGRNITSKYSEREGDKRFARDALVSFKQLQLDDSMHILKPLHGAENGHRGAAREANTGHYSPFVPLQSPFKQNVFVDSEDRTAAVKKKIFNMYAIKDELFNNALSESNLFNEDDVESRHKSERDSWHNMVTYIKEKFDTKNINKGLDENDIQAVRSVLEVNFHTIQTYIFYVFCYTLDINPGHFKKESLNFVDNYKEILQHLHSQIKETLNDVTYSIRPFYIVEKHNFQRPLIDKMLEKDPGLYTKCIIWRIYERNMLNKNDMLASVQEIFHFIQLNPEIFRKLDQTCIESNNSENEVMQHLKSISPSECDTGTLCEFIHNSILIQKEVSSKTLKRCGIQDIFFESVLEKNKTDKNEWTKTINNIIIKYKIQERFTVFNMLIINDIDFKNTIKQTFKTINSTMQHYITYKILHQCSINENLFHHIIKNSYQIREQEKSPWEKTMHNITMIYINCHISVIDEKIENPDENVKNQLKKRFENMWLTMSEYMSNIISLEFKIDWSSFKKNTGHHRSYYVVFKNVFQTFVQNPFDNNNGLYNVIMKFKIKMLQNEPHVYLICKFIDILKDNVSKRNITQDDMDSIDYHIREHCRINWTKDIVETYMNHSHAHRKQFLLSLLLGIDWETLRHLR